MKTSRILPLAFATVSLLSLSAFAISGPDHMSLRPLGMGNAFVAVVDDKDALYYNTAGLNLINSLGDADSRPDQANYPLDRMDFRIDFGANAPIYELLSFFDLYKKHRHSFSSTDSLKGDTTIGSDLTPYDRKPIPVGIAHGMELAVHNFGIGYWVNAQVSPYIDEGVFLPQAGIQTLTVDAVIQVAAARSFMDKKLSLGVGLRVANRQEVKNFQVSVAELDSIHKFLRTLKDTLNAKVNHYEDFGSYGEGVDLGALWQETPDLRFGASLENLGMFLNGVAVTPKLTTGLAYTPSLLCSGGKLSRKVNLALDLEDLLNNDRNYKFFSKIDMGAEIQQDLWWLMSARISGGFKGGYWTAGAGLSLLSALHVDAASWANEDGYYTGQIEDRYYAVNLSLGF